MLIYILLAIFSVLGLVLIFIRRQRLNKNLWFFTGSGQKLFAYGEKYIFSRFKKQNKSFINIPVETSAPDAAHCPAAVIGNETVQPRLETDDQKEMEKYFLAGEKAFKKDYVDEAEKAYIKALSFNENHVEANLRLGVIYLKKNLPMKAEAIFKKLLGINCGDAVVYSNLGNAFYMQQRYPESCEAYVKSAELDSSNPKRFLNIGRVTHEMGNYDATIENINKAISLDPNNPDSYAALADAYVSLGNLDRAKEVIDQGLKIDKNNLNLKAVSKKIKHKKPRK
ncbi:MAG: TPR Domain containing protein [Candidatus Peregrinibacteria bacterium GW2011_GWF2_38_29]|nr:MAG: TPR Domain containing protein [Candidatus Peregrinibacteria bacterium GW2011_GWF2_38_29]HBB03232.1 hypothetical protein [Candidatus Peregrinibacteria bacterium]